jgi:methylated-DNA-[protein]-cysteine S-methyltransferase
MTRHELIDSPLGELTLVADGDALTGLYFRHHWYPPATVGRGVEGDPLFARAKAQLDEYFAGRRTEFELPTSVSGTEFERRVWDEIAAIPYGETTTYGEIAGRLGGRSLAQDVGRAVGHNPLSIIVACHRVVGANGRLTGYAGGLKRKALLLGLEQPALFSALSA